MGVETKEKFLLRRGDFVNLSLGREYLLESNFLPRLTPMVFLEEDFVERLSSTLQ